MIILTGMILVAWGNVRSDKEWSREVTTNEGGMINTYRLINIMFLYTLVIKISNIGGWVVSSVGLFNGIVKIETSELILGLILIILGCMSQVGSGRNDVFRENGVIILLIMTGMWMTVISKDWISIILSIELQSNGIYLLVCKRAIGSGLRYNIIGGISSSIMMISILKIYSDSGLSNIEEIKIWNEFEGCNWAEYGVILGILIKMGTAPMHNWISDVMENISNTENQWVGGISKLPLVKIISVWGWKEVMIIIITLAIGGILGSTVYRIKKFIAYSGIHNLGYVLIIAGGGSGSGIWLFFITQYVITLISILMLYREDVGRDNGWSEDVTIWSIRDSNKWVGVAITISMLSSIGIPPLIGFYGKLSIMEWGLENGWGIITVIIIIGSVLSGRNYIRIVRNTWSGNIKVVYQGYKVYEGYRCVTLSVLVSLMISNIVERYTQCI